MSSRMNAVRPLRFISAPGAVVGAIVLLMPAAASAVAPVAGATTIHACVSKKSGAMRIVSAKAKCKRGEHKLSWGSTGPTGPAGAAGATGAVGAPGANGVGVDFASENAGPVSLAEGEKGAVVVAETIPAGSYFASAKTVIVATKGKSGVSVGVVCELVDTTGTPAIVEIPDALDESIWFQGLSQSGSEWEAVTTLALQGQLTTTEATTVALVCLPAVGSKEATVLAGDAEVSALQTTANK
jgi:hypothetical protein